MAHFETFEFHPEYHHHIHPIALLLLIASVAIFFLVIGAFSQARRRNARQRALQKGSFDQLRTGPPSVPLPRSTPVGVCQRCHSALLVEAEYCARCGLRVTRPTPLPMPRQRTQPGNSRWLIYAIILLLGLVGFGAYWFMSDSELVPDAPTPPAHQHAPSDAW